MMQVNSRQHRELKMFLERWTNEALTNDESLVVQISLKPLKPGSLDPKVEIRYPDWEKLKEIEEFDFPGVLNKP